MSATNLSPTLFFSEIKTWGATEGALIKVRIMQIGTFIHCRLKLPNNGEFIQTKFTRKEYDASNQKFTPNSYKDIRY